VRIYLVEGCATQNFILGHVNDGQAYKKECAIALEEEEIKEGVGCHRWEVVREQ